MDVMLDYNFNLGQGNLMLSVAGLHVLSCVYGRRKHTMCTVNPRIKLKISWSFNDTSKMNQHGIIVLFTQYCITIALLYNIEPIYECFAFLIYTILPIFALYS